MANLTIINFHGIGEPPDWVDSDERPYWITVPQFEEIIAIASRYRDEVQITFDDGNASDHDIAFPRLVQARLKGDFFFLTGRIDTPAYVSRAQIHTMFQAGMGVGLHGHAHVDWRSLGSEDADLELRTARSELSSIIDAPVDRVAIPFGKYNRQVIKRLRREGFLQVFTSDGGRTRPGAWLSPRFSVRADTLPTELVDLIRRGPPIGSMVRRFASMSLRRHLI